jgi:fatty acid desaturase
MARNPFARKSSTSEAQPAAPKKQGRLSQILDVYRVSRESDPAIGWWMLLAFLGTFVVFLIIGIVLSLPWMFGFFGILFGVLAATIIMSRRAERAAYSKIDGQAGAAGAALT